MQIISHRGWWKSSDEKNEPIAFEREFQYCSDLVSKFYKGGVETDIRDYNGSLVISHDIATQDSLSLDKFLSLYSSYNIHSNSTLALNIKSDGLQEILKSKISQYNIQNYFFFDMSIPDILGYIRHGLNIFTRQSEYKFN